MTDDVKRLRRVKLFVHGCFWLGIVASLAANVLHADNNPISQIVAAWAPVALLFTVELLSRVPISTRSVRSWLRIAATVPVAAIAAWVSYWHMVGVAQQYGETGYTPYLLPISVDGLVVIASISLVEINHRVRERDTPIPATQDTPAGPDTTPAPQTPPATPSQPAKPPATTSEPAKPPVTIPANTFAAIAADHKPKPNGDSGHVQDALL